jgi:hypothetical protein
MATNNNLGFSASRKRRLMAAIDGTRSAGVHSFPVPGLSFFAFFEARLVPTHPQIQRPCSFHQGHSRTPISNSILGHAYTVNGAHSAVFIHGLLRKQQQQQYQRLHRLPSMMPPDRMAKRFLNSPRSLSAAQLDFPTRPNPGRMSGRTHEAGGNGEMTL